MLSMILFSVNVFKYRIEVVGNGVYLRIKLFLLVRCVGVISKQGFTESRYDKTKQSRPTFNPGYCIEVLSLLEEYILVKMK